MRIHWLLIALPVLAQSPAKVPDDLRFEVASLKPGAPNPQFSGIRPAPGGQRYVATNCTINTMLQVAYRVKTDQIVGGPAWLNSDRFDMEAKAEKPSTGDELHVMLINMLVDRLKLKFHHEKKEMRMYALTVGKDGSKMTRHDAASGGDPWMDQAQSKFLHLQLTATMAPMDYVAYRLSQFMDAPVVNLTTLPGDYDFKLEFTRDLPPGFTTETKLNGETVDTSGPNIFEALKKQLGLELKSQKGPVDVIVIDHAEKPTEN